MEFLKLKKLLSRSRKVNIDIPKSFGKNVDIIIMPSKSPTNVGKLIPGKSYLPASGKVMDDHDLKNLIESSHDLWLTAGRYAQQFEKKFPQFIGVKHCSLVNSGSSANLLAICALTSPRLKNRRLQPGDEVITVAAGFPTTVAPLVQNELVPVFLDIETETYNIDVSQLQEAVSGKTKAIMIAHTLGNPFNLSAVQDICQKHNLWLIEDNCDALGSEYSSRRTGSFGHLATHSFYPAHHITMGEGGAVVTNDLKLNRIVNSFRDWGRDCWCLPGKSNTCNNRFGWQLGDLPHGYDHKYIYSHLGYNLKVTDMQAAVGLTQLKKLPSFIKKRRKNWKRLYNGLKKLEDYIILPRATEHSDPSWFGFLITVRPNSPRSRNDLVKYLESHQIGTRMLFSGNLIKQPAFSQKDIQYRVSGQLTNTDLVMANTFWIGVWPGLDDDCIDYMITKIQEAFQ